eukprot:1152606-Pelagomonas_calceolata.AAC.2
MQRAYSHQEPRLSTPPMLAVKGKGYQPGILFESLSIMEIFSASCQPIHTHTLRPPNQEQS